MKTLIKSLDATGVVAAFLMSAPITTTSAYAYQCKNSPTQSIGLAKLRMRASMKSRRNWTSSVKSQMGLGWSVWNISTSKSISCTKLASQWRCLANAKPCLYVVQ